MNKGKAYKEAVEVYKKWEEEFPQDFNYGYACGKYDLWLSWDILSIFLFGFILGGLIIH
jgi:hypothetical protein